MLNASASLAGICAGSCRNFWHRGTVTPDRFFSLMLLLESRDAVTTHDLASALGVSLRTITRDLNWLRDAGLPVTAQRGRYGGVTMLPGSALDLTRLTPGERDHLSITGLDEKQREELDTSAESRRALSKVAVTRTGRADGLLPFTVHGPAEVRARLHDLAAELFHHHAPRDG